MDRTELLVREYETVVSQLIHFNQHSWTKSQFFFTVQALFLGFAGLRLASELGDGRAIFWGPYVLLIAAALFNVILCYLWFRSLRSNREWFDARLERARQIEEALSGLAGGPMMFALQTQYLSVGRRAKHSSGWWEVHFADFFIAAWFAILFLATWDTGSPRLWAVPVGLLVVTILGITVVEWWGGPRFEPRRGQAPQ